MAHSARSAHVAIWVLLASGKVCKVCQATIRAPECHSFDKRQLSKCSVGQCCKGPQWAGNDDANRPRKGPEWAQSGNLLRGSMLRTLAEPKGVGKAGKPTPKISRRLAVCGRYS